MSFKTRRSGAVQKRKPDVRRHISGVCVNGRHEVVQDLAGFGLAALVPFEIFRKSSQNFSQRCHVTFVARRS